MEKVHRLLSDPLAYTEAKYAWYNEPVSQDVVDEIVDDPQSWLESNLQRMKADAKKTYFITFTKREDIKNAYFYKRVRRELTRKHVGRFWLAFEHKDTNLHAHVKLWATKYLKHQDFESFKKNVGRVDLSPVGQDHGIRDYMEKEGQQIIQDVQDIKID